MRLLFMVRGSFRYYRAAIFCAVAVLGCATATRPARVVAGEALEAGVALATFDSIWTIVHNTYVDTVFVSSRWGQVRDSLRPRAAAITTRRELDDLLAETLHRIPDSHFYLIPASVASADTGNKSIDGRGTTGLVVRVVGDDALAWRVEPGGPAAGADIRPGQIVRKIGIKDARISIRRVRSMPEVARPRAMSEVLHALNGALSPAVGDTVKVEIGRGRGSVSRNLVVVRAVGTVSQYGNLPPIAGLVRSSRMPAPGGMGCIGVVGFNVWLPALVADIERAMDSVRTCAGVIVDLRGNPGGVGAMVMGFGGYFVDSVRSLGTMRMRQLSLNFVINPRRSRDDGTAIEPFTGPIAILVDPMTASTSEIFAAGMQRIGRARVFGERSAGAALPALMDRLPSGDVFVHAVADFTDPEGKRIEGTGVVPDEIVPLSAAVLSAGRDGAMEAAISWIARIAVRI